jgi:pyruvate kinase
MHVCSDGRLLKTKIVATVGPERGGLRGNVTDEIYDLDGNPQKDLIPHGVLLEWLIREGVDVIRLNMSFAALQEPYGLAEGTVLRWLGEHNDDLAKRIAVLGDLPGPKIRLNLDNSHSVGRGDRYLLDFRDQDRFRPEELGASVFVNQQPFERLGRVSGYATIGEYIRKSASEVVFYVGDGKVILSAESERNGIVSCRVSKSGAITPNQGLTIKRAAIEVPPFQEPDRKALDFLLDQGRDVIGFVGLSFVRNADDVENAKRYVEQRLVSQGLATDHKASRRTAPIMIAKIETAEAWQNIDEILDVADGLMIARGDLGLQLDPQDVPNLQKQLIHKCNLRGKPVITATQMLDSMEENWEPTRAEAMDVFNAILDGTDAVMLSGETSKGKYPAQAVRTMVNIAERAEDYYFEQHRHRDLLERSDALIKGNNDRLRRKLSDAASSAENPTASPEEREIYGWKRDLYAEKLVKSKKQITTDRISQAACILSEGDDYSAILAPTTSGRTARMISRFRPLVPIIGVAHDDANARKLMLSFGVFPVCIGDGQQSVEDVLESALAEAQKLGYINWLQSFRLLREQDMVITTCGTPLFVPGTTNLIQIRKAKGSGTQNFLASG